MSKKITKSKIEWLYSNGFLWLVLGAMISVDYLQSKEAFETAIETYSETLEALPNTSLPDDTKESVRSSVEYGLKFLRETYEKLSDGEQNG